MNRDYFDKAIKSFNGERFYLSYLDSGKYLSRVGNEFTVYSEAPLNKRSEKYSNIYKTKFDIEDLNDITRAKMFIKYKGNEYEAWDVAVGFEEVLLNARNGHEKEDIEKNGFECHQIDQYTRWINRWIKKEDIEDIRIEETSVYEEFLNKYGNQNKDRDN